MSDRLVVNEHYLNRVVAVGEASGVEATEDILSGTGVKLLAKGARIDGKVKDRLLQHKLLKPLESSVRVIDISASRSMDAVAESLLQRHSLIAGVCGVSAARTVRSMLRELRLSTPVESLLSIYAAQGPTKLEHAVGVALLGAAMMHALPQGSDQTVQVLLRAGLMHDVGDLYIDPTILLASGRLSGDEWKHVATHPIVAARLLRDMAGGGPAVAEAVLHHHERLDGFGYPHGVRGDQLPLTGQVLAFAEMLMAIIESDRNTHERASVAVKLIPGEFNRTLLDKVARATQSAKGTAQLSDTIVDNTRMEELVQQAAALDANLHRVLGLQSDVQVQFRSGSRALQELMTHVIERCQRIRQAFSSTGLDSHGPDELRQRVVAMGSDVHIEIGIVLREIEWRLREVKRELRVRAERLSPAEAALVSRFVELSKPADKRSEPATQS